MPLTRHACRYRGRPPRRSPAQVLRTPMLPAPQLSALTGAEVFVKYENLQVTNSFKERGALRQARLAHARPSARAASSPCRPAITPRRSPITRARLGIPATIVMPVTTPFVKVAATRGARRRGACSTARRVAEAQARAEAIARERGLDLGASLRRSAHHRRAGHHRARNAGGGARPRRAGDSDRRRRADRRQRHRRARDQAGDRDRRRRRPRSIRRCGTRSTASNRPIGGATLAEGIAVKNVGKLTLPVVRELVSRHRAGRRGASRARGQRLSHLAEDHGGRRGRRRACRHAGRAGALPRAARSA